jgi:hypothetical protein
MSLFSFPQKDGKRVLLKNTSKNHMIPEGTQEYKMKLPEAVSYKPPMTDVRSGTKYENGKAIFIGKG